MSKRRQNQIDKIDQLISGPTVQTLAFGTKNC